MYTVLQQLQLRPAAQGSLLIQADQPQSGWFPIESQFNLSLLVLRPARTDPLRPVHLLWLAFPLGDC